MFTLIINGDMHSWCQRCFLTILQSLHLLITQWICFSINIESCFSSYV